MSHSLIRPHMHTEQTCKLTQGFQKDKTDWMLCWLPDYTEVSYCSMVPLRQVFLKKPRITICFVYEKRFTLTATALRRRICRNNDLS